MKAIPLPPVLHPSHRTPHPRPPTANTPAAYTPSFPPRRRIREGIATSSLADAGARGWVWALKPNRGWVSRIPSSFRQNEVIRMQTRNDVAPSISPPFCRRPFLPSFSSRSRVREFRIPLGFSPTISLALSYTPRQSLDIMSRTPGRC